MKNFLRNTKKGFTLIELLAVITILAVLVLVAIPAVTGLMNKSIMGSFRTDALTMAQSGIQTAYSTKILNGAVVGPTVENQNYADDKIHRATSGADYLCMGLDQLVKENYLTKNDYESYGGYLQIMVNSDGTTSIAFNLTDGKYYIQTTYKKLSESTDVTTQVLSSKPADGAVVGVYTCPNQMKMIADE